MKKILNILGALSLVSVCGSSIVACDTDTEGDTNEKGDGETPTEKAVKLSELFTKLEIDFKGENKDNPILFETATGSIEGNAQRFMIRLLSEIVNENTKINSEIFSKYGIGTTYLTFTDYNRELVKLDTPEMKNLKKSLIYNQNADLETTEDEKWKIQVFKEVTLTYIIQPELFLSSYTESHVKIAQKIIDVVELEPLELSLKNFRVKWYINS